MDWKTRVEVELEDLQAKMVKLEPAFTNPQVPARQRDLLRIQLGCMSAYAEVLILRLKTEG